MTPPYALIDRETGRAWDIAEAPHGGNIASQARAYWTRVDNIEAQELRQGKSLPEIRKLEELAKTK